jgi:hypothetical protein
VALETGCGGAKSLRIQGSHDATLVFSHCGSVGRTLPAVDRAYIKGRFLSPHGNLLVDLVNPTNNKVIGKVTMEPKAIIS